MDIPLTRPKKTRFLWETGSFSGRLDPLAGDFS